MSRKLERPRQGRMIGGVCAGLANYFGISPTVMRLLAIASCLLPGPQFVAYLVLWVVIPNSPQSSAWTPMPSEPRMPSTQA